MNFDFSFFLIFSLLFPDRKKKILMKLLDMFSQCCFQVFFDQLGLESESPEIKRRTNRMFVREADRHTYVFKIFSSIYTFT